jgi:hypothetical protein
MNRRRVLALVAGAAASLPFVTGAAGEPAKILRLGVLTATGPGPGVQAFLEQLHVLGWEEGRNLQTDYLQLDADPDRFRAMTAELVNRGVDLIRASGTEIVLKTAIAVTRTVPIVMVATDYDPLALGYIASLTARRQCDRRLHAADRVDSEAARIPNPDNPQTGARGCAVGPILCRPVRSCA